MNHVVEAQKQAPLSQIFNPNFVGRGSHFWPSSAETEMGLGFQLKSSVAPTSQTLVDPQWAFQHRLPKHFI